MDLDKETEEKIEALEKLIAEAREDSADLFDQEHKSPAKVPGSLVAGSEFLSLVFSGAFIGYGIDVFFATKPWGIIVMFLFGFIAGIYRLHDAMQKNDT